MEVLTRRYSSEDVSSAEMVFRSFKYAGITQWFLITESKFTHSKLDWKEIAHLEFLSGFT